MSAITIALIPTATQAAPNTIPVEPVMEPLRYSMEDWQPTDALTGLPPRNVAVVFLADGTLRLVVECKGKAFPWFGECWSRFEGDEFAEALRARGVDPEEFKANYPELAKVFKGDWPSPAPWSDEWLLAHVNAVWPQEDEWYRIGVCESGEDPPNWRHNSGTFEGALGFHYGSWDDWNEFGFPNRADLASPAQQMYVAERIYDAYGLEEPWGCASAAYN